eukprot:scaffold269664_cov39-Tisochrysis_lutea.AAC.1
MELPSTSPWGAEARGDALLSTCARSGADGTKRDRRHGQRIAAASPLQPTLSSLHATPTARETASALSIESIHDARHTHTHPPPRRCHRVE